MVCLRNICVNTLHKGDSIFIIIIIIKQQKKVVVVATVVVAVAVVAAAVAVAAAAVAVAVAVVVDAGRFRVNKYRTPDRPGDYILYGGATYMCFWAVGM
jgi:type IV secretory pathway protease TraF